MRDLCRLCFKKHNLIWVFDSRFKCDLTNVIKNASGVEIRKTDTISQMICTTCLSINHKISRYRTTSIKNDSILKRQYQQSNNIHFSVKEVMQKHPLVKIPTECLQLHLGAYITVERNEVDDWFKERNVNEEEIQKLIKEAIERNVNEEEIEKPEQETAETSAKKKKKRKRNEDGAPLVRRKLYRTSFSGPQKLRFKRITTEEMMDVDGTVRREKNEFTLKDISEDSFAVSSKVQTRDSLDVQNRPITRSAAVGKEVRRATEDKNAPITRSCSVDSEVRSASENLNIINVNNGSSKVQTTTDNNQTKSRYVPLEESILDYLNASIFSDISDEISSKSDPQSGSKQIPDAKSPERDDSPADRSRYVPLEESILDYLNTTVVSEISHEKSDPQSESIQIPHAKSPVRDNPPARKKKITEENNISKNNLASRKTETLSNNHNKLKSRKALVLLEDVAKLQNTFQEEDSSDSDDIFFTSRFLAVTKKDPSLTVTPRKKSIVISSDSEEDISTHPLLPDVTNSPNMSLLSVKNKHSNLYTCKICDALLNTAKERKSHVRKTHMKCPLCNKRFRNLITRDEHQCPKKIPEKMDSNKPRTEGKSDSSVNGKKAVLTQNPLL